jgi:SOS response regulatory protein OraA/RecX
VERLQEAGYLDDTDFAWMRAVSARTQRNWGDHRISGDLTRLGLDAKIVALTLAKLEDEYPEEKALNRAVETWIQRSGPPETVSELKKLFDRCIRMGYSASQIRERLGHYFGQVNWDV